MAQSVTIFMSHVNSYQKAIIPEEILIISCTKLLKWNICEPPSSATVMLSERPHKQEVGYAENWWHELPIITTILVIAATEYPNSLLEVSSFKPLIFYNMRRVALKQVNFIYPFRLRESSKLAFQTDIHSGFENIFPLCASASTKVHTLIKWWQTTLVFYRAWLLTEVFFIHQSKDSSVPMFTEIVKFSQSGISCQQHHARCRIYSAWV